MSRSPSSSRARRARYSPTSRPRTRSTSPHYTLEDNEASLLTLVESSPPTQPATPTPIQPPTLRLPSATGSYAASPLSQCSQPDQAVEGQALIPSSPGRPPRPPRVGSPQTFPHQQSRDGKTKIYHQGFEYTRAKISAVKITYRCSFYRKPKLCPAVLYFYADTMTYDFKSSAPHTCKSRPVADLASDDSVCVNVEEEMKAFVDDLAEQDISANKIWTLTYKKFYENSTCVVRGLSRKQVVSRVGNSKSGNNIFSLLESPERSKVSGSDLGFFQFQYVWHDDTRAKQKKSGIERLVGWSHPELRNLLRIDGAHLFVDGTFRCTPKSFHQFVTLMMYDQYTELFVPVFFTLATNKTETLYTKMFTCIEFALGKDIKPGDVVCDFEGAMILAIRGLFPSTRIVGCLFHFKQACRRKLKEYRMPNDEASIAMSFGVFDMLTVIDPDKIAIQGVTWVKCEINKRCNVKGLAYSRRKWKMFWRYFSKTWLETYPPDLWNIYRVKRDIVNRTNNPLERFHRELNARMKPHPSLKYFVRSIEELAREYVVLRKSIISGDAEAPLRPPMRFPRRATLPDTGDTDSSSSDDDDDCAPGGGSSDADSELSDEDLGIVYDTSFDYEIEDDEEKSNAA